MSSPRYGSASTRGLLLAAAACAALAPAVALAQDTGSDSAPLTERRGDIVSIFSGDVHVPAGTRLDGGIVCVGGEVVIEGEVTRDVVVILGSLENRGTVHRAVTGVLTEQHHHGARVDRELVSVLGSVELENTRVGRELVNVLGPLRRDALSSTPSINIGRWLPDVRMLLLWGRVLRLLVVFVLLLILAALLPEQVRAIGEEAPVRYAAAFGVGLLGYLGFLVLFGLLAATLIGLPIALLGFWLLKWLGIAGVFHAVGLRLGRTLGREMSLLGAILLSFGLYALLMLAPTPLGLAGLLLSSLLWVVIFFVLEVPAVGLVLLRLAGARRARRAGVVAPPGAPAAPPGGPAPRV